MWEEIVALAREYTRRKYGWEPTSVTFHGPPGVDPHREPVPRAWPDREPTARQARGPRHSNDFRWWLWPDVGEFTLSPMQAKVTALLWEAREQGQPHVGQAELLRKAGSDSAKLRDLFSRGGKTHPAWGLLVLHNEAAPGSYMLPPWPPEEHEGKDEGDDGE